MQQCCIWTDFNKIVTSLNPYTSSQVNWETEKIQFYESNTTLCPIISNCTLLCNHALTMNVKFKNKNLTSFQMYQIRDSMGSRFSSSCIVISIGNDSCIRCTSTGHGIFSEASRHVLQYCSHNQGRVSYAFE